MEIASLEHLHCHNHRFHHGGSSEMMTTRLPSWGDPILPEVWQISEEEMNQKFPLPGTSISVEDYRQECCMLKMPLIDVLDDMQPLYDRDASPGGGSVDMLSSDNGDSEYGDDDDEIVASTGMLSPGNDSNECSGERDTLSSTEMRSSYNGDSEYESEDDDDDDASLSSCDRSSGRAEFREGNEEDDCSLMDTRVSECEVPVGAWPDDDLDMDTENEFGSDTSFRGPAEKPPPAEWVIEVEDCGPGNALRFKLKTRTGVIMILFQDEIVDAVSAILEDEVEGLLFEIRPVNGASILVNSSKVVKEISEAIANESRKRQAEARDDQGEEKRGRSLRVPSFGLRKKESRKDKCRDRPNRLGFAWRALSGRSKIRPRQLNRVE